MSQQQREAVITEAKNWLGTPWHHQANLKAVGVDCGYFILEVFANAGLIEKQPIENYPRDWALHKSEERFLAVVERYAHPITEPKTGDIAVFKYGRTFSHGAIVLDYPHLIHAQINHGVVFANATHAELANREVKFYSLWSS
jgi:cell wall-associated NlpC family hydrolase